MPASSASSALAVILRDVDASPAEGLAAAVSVLRRRSLLTGASASDLDAWSSRLQALLRAPAPAARCAAVTLLGETVRQCSEGDFARNREPWLASLLHLVQPVSEAITAPAAVAGATSVRLAAAEALVQMAEATATWPAQRRELSGGISRAASALLSMLAVPETQLGALLVLTRLGRASPPSLRAHRDRLGEVLPPLALEAEASTARAAVGERCFCNDATPPNPIRLFVEKRRRHLDVRPVVHAEHVGHGGPRRLLLPLDPAREPCPPKNPQGARPGRSAVAHKDLEAADVLGGRREA